MSINFQKSPMYRYLIVLSFTVAIGFQAWRTLFNNFAVDQVHLNSIQVGAIQSIREIPGFLSLLVVYLLLIIKEHRLASLSVLLMGVGVVFTGIFDSFIGVIATTLLMSTGFHYYETTNQSLTLQYFPPNEAALVIGKTKSYAALANIIAGAMIWIFSTIPFMTFEYNYMVFGGFVILVSIWAFTFDPTQKLKHKQHKKIIFKRKYWLFYVLNFLSGSRRQIFVVFSVFMLVQMYHFSIKWVTLLFIINNIIGYFANPAIARLINKYGEKRMLQIEYIALILIFSGYAIFENGYIIAALYVLDHLFFPFSMGIKTWFQKIADPKDIGSSMAVGFTINHISAVIIPFIGGILFSISWRIPFAFGILIAITSLYFTKYIKEDSLKLK
ncbi:MFS transporter [Halosquirtibacter laminarini]|uniref:MFS transporter n=1 Tax=Halosquirtibacter laminarini TaxID=3374600 RepID=A0AC61NB78_9BACT|nr:MFS transporter [Prolixibacteraceae bacterium]